MIVICLYKNRVLNSFDLESFYSKNIKIFASFNKNVVYMSIALNDVQLEILKLFRRDQSMEELNEIKSLLVSYLSDKVVGRQIKPFDNKGYSVSV